MASLDQYSDTPRRVPGSSAKAPNKANLLVTGFAALAMSACASGSDAYRAESNGGKYGATRALQSGANLLAGAGPGAQRLTEKGGKYFSAGTQWTVTKLADGTEAFGNGAGWAIRRLADGTLVLVDATGVVLGYGVNGVFQIAGGAVTVFRNVADGTVTAFVEIADRGWSGLSALGLFGSKDGNDRNATAQAQVQIPPPAYPVQASTRTQPPPVRPYGTALVPDPPRYDKK